MGKIDGTKLHTRLATSTLFQNGLINVCLNTKKRQNNNVIPLYKEKCMEYDP